MLSDNTKQRIESLSIEEMEYEVALGHRSRFQREKFAYLQAILFKRRDERVNSIPEPTASEPDDKHDWHEKPLGKIAIGVIIVIIGAMSLFLFKEHLGIPL